MLHTHDHTHRRGQSFFSFGLIYLNWVQYKHTPMYSPVCSRTWSMKTKLTTSKSKTSFNYRTSYNLSASERKKTWIYKVSKGNWHSAVSVWCAEQCSVFLSRQTLTFYTISAYSQLLSCPPFIQYSLSSSSKLIMYGSVFGSHCCSCYTWIDFKCTVH